MSFLFPSSSSLARSLLALPHATAPARLVQATVATQRYKSTTLLSPAPRKGQEVAASSTVKSKAENPGSAKTKKPKKGAEANAVVNPPKPSDYWVDASLTSIAVLIGKKYKVFKLRDGWATNGRDINWAESVGVELLAHILVARGQTGTITVNSDNPAALRVANGDRVKAVEIAGAAQRLESVIKESKIKFKGIQVRGSDNLADPFTRGKTVEGYKVMKTVIQIPEALVPYITVD